MTITEEDKKFTKDAKEHVIHKLNYMTRLCEKITKEVREIPETSDSLDYSISLLDLETLEKELWYVRRVLTEFQDLNIDEGEFP